MEEKVFKSGYVSIVGRPNVGKSTLMNAIIGQKIAITSDRAQTTRNRIQTVYHDERGQIIFLDTPGITKAKNKLGEYMVDMVNISMDDADLIMWICEANTHIGKNDRFIAERLAKLNIPVILVLNKTDLVKKEELMSCILAYNELLKCEETVPISALKNKNIEELKDVLFSKLEEGPAYFDEDTLTDQPERQIVAEYIREKALKCLKDEIPHGIAVVVDSMKFSSSKCNIEATIVCEKESHKGIIIGKSGSMLKKIGTMARKDIANFLDMNVNLKLWVKVKKGWRDSDFLLNNYGYKKEDW